MGLVLDQGIISTILDILRRMLLNRLGFVCVLIWTGRFC